MSLTTRLNIDAIENGSIPLVKLEEEVAVKSDIPDTPIVKGGANNSAVLKGEYQGYSNKALSQVSVSLGAATTAGLKGWYYSAITFGTNPVITLSDTQPYVLANTLIGGKWSSGTPAINVGDKISIVNDSKYDYCGEVKSISGNKITLKAALPFDSLATSLISANDPDDWTIYLPERADAGIIDMGAGAFAEGVNTQATNIGAHAEGIQTHAYGQYSHAEGIRTEAGYAAHAEGGETIASGTRSHAEGLETNANGKNSHAEGNKSIASGENSHAEGMESEASGKTSHVEGYQTKATKDSSHAEGWKTQATGTRAHAEGSESIASGKASHAGGIKSTASAEASFAHGHRVEATNNNEVAFGKYNVSEPGTVFSIGNGTDGAPYNIVTIKNDLGAGGGKSVSTNINGNEINLSTSWSPDNTSGITLSDNSEDGGETLLKVHGTYGIELQNNIGGNIELNSFNEYYDEQRSSKLEVDAWNGVNIEHHGVDSGDICSYVKLADENLEISFASGTDDIHTQSASYYSCTTKDSVLLDNTGVHIDISCTGMEDGYDEITEIKNTNVDISTNGVTINGSQVLTTQDELFTKGNGAGSVIVKNRGCISDGQYSTVIGRNGRAFGNYSYVEGRGQGNPSSITKDNAETAWDNAEASDNTGDNLHLGVGDYAHVEGLNNIAVGNCTHVEGQRNKAKGVSSHAEGWKTQAIGNRSHAEGQSTQANGNESHAGGVGSIATGARSFVHGNYVNTTNNDEVAFGTYNNSTTNTVFSVGSGTSNTNRKNAFEITKTVGYIYDKQIATINDIPTTPSQVGAAPANHNHTITLTGTFMPNVTSSYNDGVLTISTAATNIEYTGTTDIENTNANPESWFVETDDIRALFANEVGLTDTL
jgi:hypothetical protein